VKAWHSACALFLAAVVGLYLGEVRPQHEDRVYRGADGKPFHLPTWLPGDCPFYRATALSLLREKDLDLRDDMAWNVVRPQGQVSLGARGEWYPKHPLLLPVAALPFYAAGGDEGLLAFNVVQVALLDVFIFFLARRFTSDPIALGVALWFAFGSFLRPVAYNFSPDVLSTLVIVAGYLALVAGRFGLSGLLFGLAVTAKWTNLVFLPIAALFAMGTAGLRPALRFALAAAPVLAALAFLDFHMFGSPLVTPYDRVLGEGLQVESSHRTLFDRPFLAGLWTQIVDPRLGLLRSAPQALFALPGFFFLARRRGAEAVLCAALCAAQMAVFAPYRMWDASNYGHRFWMTAIVLCAVPVAALADRALRGAVAS
jgi:hypothetical protein